MKAVGVNGQVELMDGAIRITREGMIAKASFMGHGEKVIKFSSISSVQFKAPSLFANGFIHFVFSGGETLGGSTVDAAQNDNAVVFKKKQLPEFKEIYESVIHKIS